MAQGTVLAGCRLLSQTGGFSCCYFVSLFQLLWVSLCSFSGGCEQGFSWLWLPFFWSMGSRACGLQRWPRVDAGVVAPARSAASGAVLLRRSCSVACGIFPDQGSNLCPLQWRADALPLDHREAQVLLFSVECRLLSRRDSICSVC